MKTYLLINPEKIKKLRLKAGYSCEYVARYIRDAKVGVEVVGATIRNWERTGNVHPNALPIMAFLYTGQKNPNVFFSKKSSRSGTELQNAS